jgi:hypothetical protein
LPRAQPGPCISGSGRAAGGQSGVNTGELLETVSALGPGGKLRESILRIYEAFRQGGGAADIRRAAELLRAEENRNVV